MTNKALIALIVILVFSSLWMALQIRSLKDQNDLMVLQIGSLEARVSALEIRNIPKASPAR
ncbi:hypothetical protein C2W62_04905 [Candidatus Entotheonella serta]|nr:hypothetical protein C2W62_04905 [Candidatus Entotheonella serta]